MIGVKVHIKDTGPLRLSPRVDVELGVGLSAEAAAKRHPGGLPLGVLARIHEFGMAALGIPARMLFRGWAAEHQRKEAAITQRLVRDMVRTQKWDAEPFKVQVQRMRATLVGRIMGGLIRPLNAISTLRKKAPETRPLVESGTLARAMQGELEVRSPGRGINLKYRTGGG